MTMHKPAASHDINDHRLCICAYKGDHKWNEQHDLTSSSMLRILGNQQMIMSQTGIVHCFISCIGVRIVLTFPQCLPS